MSQVLPNLDPRLLCVSFEGNQGNQSLWRTTRGCYRSNFFSEGLVITKFLVLWSMILVIFMTWALNRLPAFFRYQFLRLVLETLQFLKGESVNRWYLKCLEYICKGSLLCNFLLDLTKYHYESWLTNAVTGYIYVTTQ